MTTQERLGNAIDTALNEGFIDSFYYTELDKSGKIIGGCAQTAAIKGLGYTDEEILWESLSVLANAPYFLMENINTLHCCGKVTARAISELLKENKVPEVAVEESILKALALGLPTRKGEYAVWNRQTSKNN